MNQNTVIPSENRPEYRRRHGIFFPLLLITAGIVFLLSNAGYISTSGWSAILNLWPVLFIVGALDSLWRGDGIAGPILWLGLGVLFLLGNLGYIPVSTWQLLWRFWPVLLIVIGIDIVIGRQKTVWAQIVAVILALAVLGGLAWFAISQPVLVGSRVDSQQISETMPAVSAVDWNINMNAGSLQLRGGADANQLIQGNLSYARQDRILKDLQVSGDRATYTLRETGTANGFGISNSRNPWELKLNDKVASEIHLSVGAGDVLLDQSSIDLRALEVDQGVGKLIIMVRKGGHYSGKINMAVGELVIQVPLGTSINIASHSAITAVQVDGNFQKVGDQITPISTSGPADINLEVSNAIGSIKVVTLP